MPLDIFRKGRSYVCMRSLVIYVLFSLSLMGNFFEFSQANLPISEGRELVGLPAPELTGLVWLNSEPLQLEDLKSRVILIRFWLQGCPYCSNTAPALNELYDRYQDEGLLVIGIHHPKSHQSNQMSGVIDAASKLGFRFPVAHDRHWKVINAYWLRDQKRAFTSSSFLVDRQGIIRWVHAGGEYYREGPDAGAKEVFRDLEFRIRELLAE